MIQDKDLLIFLKNNPEKGLEILMNTYAGLVYAIVYNKLSTVSTKEDIEESVSDIFVDFYHHIELIDMDKGSIKAYLSTIAKRKAIDRYRKLKRDTHQTDYLVDLQALPSSFITETNLIAQEVKDTLIRAILSLGKPDSQIFILKYYLGYSSKMIAKQLELKVNTIDKKISRGLNKLKGLLEGVI